MIGTRQPHLSLAATLRHIPKGRQCHVNQYLGNALYRTQKVPGLCINTMLGSLGAKNMRLLSRHIWYLFLVLGQYSLILENTRFAHFLYNLCWQCYICIKSFRFLCPESAVREVISNQVWLSWTAPDACLRLRGFATNTTAALCWSLVRCAIGVVSIFLDATRLQVYGRRASIRNRNLKSFFFISIGIQCPLDSQLIFARYCWGVRDVYGRHFRYFGRFALVSR